MCTAYDIGRRKGGQEAPGFRMDVASLLLSLDHSLIRPTLQAPVVLPDAGAQLMHWGFRRSFAAKRPGGKPVQRTIVNSREDKLASPMWRDAFRHRRCLIPASGFYEWIERGGRNVPFRFTRTDDDWLFIAGIWEEAEDGTRCYSMITTEPTEAIAPIHDRMPAVLAEEQMAPYLAGDLHEFGPSSVPLAFREAPNFLKAPPGQGELF